MPCPRRVAAPGTPRAGRRSAAAPARLYARRAPAVRIPDRGGTSALHRPALRRPGFRRPHPCPAPGAGAGREGGRAAGRAVAGDEAEARDRVRVAARAQSAAVRRAADRARPRRDAAHETDDRRARAAGGRGDSQLSPAAPGRRGVHARAGHSPRAAGGDRDHRGDRRIAPRPPGSQPRRGLPRLDRHVISAALYLSRRSLANATRRRLARLRQPKYLIGFAVGLLYYYLIIARRRAPGGGAWLPGSGGEALAILGLTTILVINWLFGSSRSPFAFTPAETHYLFTAPMTRRQVLDFKLLRSQLPLFLSSVISVLLFSGGHLSASRIVRVLGLWLVFSALQMHYGVAALVRQSLEEHGVTAVRRRLGVITVLTGVAVAVAVILRVQVPEVQAVCAAEAAAADHTAVP